MFTAIGRIVTRGWPVILAAWAAILGVTVWLAPSWRDVVLDREFAYLPADAPSREGEEVFKQAFPNQYTPSTFVLVVHRDEGPLSQTDLDFIEHSLTPGLEQIRNNPPEEDGEKGSIIDHIVTFKEPGAGTLLISADRKASLVVLELTTEMLQLRNWPTLKKINDLLDQLQQEGKTPAGLTISKAGSAAIGRNVTEDQARSGRHTEYWTIAFVVVLLLLLYRSLLLTLVPLVTMVVAVKVTLNLLAMAATHGLITLFEGMQIYIIIVMYGTGIDYSLFLLSRCKEEVDAGEEIRDAVASAIAKVGVPLTASAATVALGIGMMTFARFGEFHFAGLAVGGSLFVGWCAAMTLAPSLLRLFGKRPFKRTASAQTHYPVWEWLAGQLQRRPAKILLGISLLMFPFTIIAFYNRNNLEYDFLKRLPDSAPSAVGSRVLGEHFPRGLTAPIIVVLRQPGFDFQSDSGQDAMQTLTDRLLRQKQELNLADIRSLAYPLGTSQAAQDALDELAIQFQEKGGKGIDPNEQAAKYYVSHKDTTQLQLILQNNPLCRKNLDLMDRLETMIRAELPSQLRDAEFHVLGFTSSIHDLRNVTAHDELRIELLVVLCVFAILLIVLRHIVVALFLIISVLFGFAAALGVTVVVFELLNPAGFAGLDWKVPIFLFVILMAIGADYNIFLLTRVRELEHELEPVAATATALVKTGRIINSCGIIMAGTFASLLTGHLVDLKQLGFALSFGVLLDTFLIRPVVVPAFLMLLHARLADHSLGGVRAADRHPAEEIKT